MKSCSTKIDLRINKNEIKREIIASSVVNLSLVNVGVILYFIEITTRENYVITPWKDYITISCVTFGFLFGAISTDFFGSKLSLIIINVPIITTWLLIKFSSNRIQGLIAFGCLHFNACYIFTPVLCYISEITHPKARSSLLTSSFLFISLGTIIEIMLEKFFRIRTISILNCIVPIISFTLLLSIIPENPNWLIRKDKISKTKNSLRWFLNDTKNEDDIDTKLKLLLKENGKPYDLWIANPEYSMTNVQEENNNCLSLLFKRKFINTITLINFIYFTLNFTGLISIKYTFSLLKIRISSFNLIYEIFQILGTLISIVFQRLLGRRLLNLTTITYLGFFNLALGIYYYVVGDINDLNRNNSIILKIVALLLLTGAVIIINIGLKSLPWLLSGELYENRLKYYGTSFSGIFNYLFEFIFKLFFLKGIQKEEISINSMFLFYAFLSFICVIFLNSNLIETEGKRLYDIQKIINNDRINNLNKFKRNNKTLSTIRLQEI